MSALVSKISSQAFFLQILKIIVQIREAVRLASTKKTSNQTTEAAMDMSTTSNASETTATIADTDVSMNTTQTTSTLILDNAKTLFSRNGKSSTLIIIIIIYLFLYFNFCSFFFFFFEEKATLPLLSESLVLGNLWETLSACLLELEYTPDHHAVLVLQHAVEAFFLVHSS
ncbi:E3 ubiquitin-protein ligase HUWE1-like [Cardiocondyla obscurior]|uniref:E3 ubiquitin-protein ligase HUWE1-like n=1 Tax=Cardiocondyla obscurior TaxID=286306 RepID=UPI0039656858